MIHLLSLAVYFTNSYSLLFMYSLPQSGSNNQNIESNYSDDSNTIKASLYMERNPRYITC